MNYFIVSDLFYKINWPFGFLTYEAILAKSLLAPTPQETVNFVF